MSKERVEFQSTWRSDFGEQSPLFVPLLPAWDVVVSAIGHVPSAFPSLAQWNDVFRAQGERAPRSGCGVPLTLVSQAGVRLRRRRRAQAAAGAGPAGDALEDNYQARLFLKGELSTRAENWHDFFNALCCLAYPRTKAVLNARHFWALDERQETLPWAPSLGEKRSPEQDFLTHFDEGGVVVVTSDEALLEALKERHWHDVFWNNRAHMGTRMEFFTFGHALFETFLAGQRSQHALGVAVKVEPSFFHKSVADRVRLADEGAAWVLEDRQATASPADGFPVPLLGFPGYVAANAHEAFYRNERYFRSR